MASATTSANSTLTRAEVERILIQPLTQKSTFLRVGFPTFTSNGEPIKVPSLSTFGTATFVAQGTAVPEVTPTTSEIELLSSSVYSLKVMSRVSNELVRQSFLGIEEQFSSKLVSDVSRILDNALWNGGTATTGSPVGLFQVTGFTNAGTVAGTALASGDLFDMEKTYMEAYADVDTSIWALSPVNFTRVRKFTDNYGSRVLQPALSEGAPGTILGHPYVVSKHIPDTAIALIDRSQIAVGMDNRASVTLLDQTYAAYDETGIRVTARYDTKPMNATAIVKLTIS